MKNERDVKRKAKVILDSINVYWFMPVQIGYGRAGVPDLIICLDGKFVAIETKFGANKPTLAQAAELDRIRAAGGVAFVVNERNIDQLKDALLSLRGSFW
jgi:hypothetical protein